MANKTEQALRQEVFSLRQVLATIGTYIYTKDLDGRYTYANQLVCDLFGRPLSEVVGKDDSHFFDLQISDQLRQNDRRVMELGETLTREETNIVRPSGETRVYWTVKAPVRDEQGQIIGMCGISTDITERKRLESELQQQRALLDTVLDTVDSYIYMKSADRRYLYLNERTAQLFGKPVADILGKRDDEVTSEETAAHFGEADRKVLETGQRVAGEEVFTDEHGRQSYYWSVKVPLALPGQPHALLGFSTDITELVLLKQELERQAMTDMLTGISNRRHFMQSLENEFARARRHGHALSVMILDVDHFKQINDRYGHLAGDRVLTAMAAHLQSRMRHEDLLSRIGGEEFAIILPETDGQGACDLALRLCESVRSTSFPVSEGMLLQVTVSIGVSALQASSKDCHSLLQLADKALYLCKDAGRDRTCLLM